MTFTRLFDRAQWFGRGALTLLAANFLQPYACASSPPGGKIVTGSSSAREDVAPPPLNILTHHNDNFRSGANLQETTLSVDNVNSLSFGRVGSYPVVGDVYAQPLYVSNLEVTDSQGNVEAHNVLIVATEANNVYAFDADAPGSASLWSVNLGVPAPPSLFGCRDFDDTVGVTSTPVVDLDSNTLYVVAKTWIVDEVVTYTIHAIQLADGVEKGSTAIHGTAEGHSDGDEFNARWQLNRPGLLLTSRADPGISDEGGPGDANLDDASLGNVASGDGGSISKSLYVAFGGQCDAGPYHGWIFQYDASSLNPLSLFNSTPDAKQGGIWQSGQGLASDGIHIYAMTGNGDSATPPTGPKADYGSSFLTLDLDLNVLASYKPADYAFLDVNDLDFGSSGPVLLPNNQMFAGTKKGLFYLFSRPEMGQDTITPPFLATDRIHKQPVPYYQYAHVHSAPVYWNTSSLHTYVWAEDDYLRAFTLDQTLGTFTPQGVGSSAVGENTIGAALSLSANGDATNSGIVWALHSTLPELAPAPSGILRAYDALDVTHELWNSANELPPFQYAKFNPPTVAAGRVYVPTTSGRVDVYGLLPHE